MWNLGIRARHHGRFRHSVFYFLCMLIRTNGMAMAPNQKPNLKTVSEQSVARQMELIRQMELVQYVNDHMSNLAYSYKEKGATLLRKKSTAIVVCRHGERLDYNMYQSGGNWVPTAETPWDPPLTDQGYVHGNVLGREAAKALQEQGLEPVSAVYCSPFKRCRQTAVATVNGLKPKTPIKVRVETGLSESWNEPWYRSWGVSGSDGSWDYYPKNEDGTRAKIPIDSVHPQAKIPIQSMMEDFANDQSVPGMDQEYSSIHKIETEYKWGTFETEDEGRIRQKNLLANLAKRHAGETIMLIGHGGPNKHLYEELTGNEGSAHGSSTYGCYSIYEQSKEGWTPKLININTSNSGWG